MSPARPALLAAVHTTCSAEAQTECGSPETNAAYPHYKYTNQDKYVNQNLIKWLTMCNLWI